MVKEIKKGFDTILRPIIEARALRDRLAEEARRQSRGINWNGSTVLMSDRKTRKTENTKIV